MVVLSLAVTLPLAPLPLRDQLHQTGQRAAGCRGPEAGHARGGRHEAAGRRPARALSAHRPRSHSSHCSPQKQEEQSVSAKVPAVAGIRCPF